MNCLIIYTKNVSFILETEGPNKALIVFVVIVVLLVIVGVLIVIYRLKTVKSTAKVGIAIRGF